MYSKLAKVVGSFFGTFALLGAVVLWLWGFGIAEYNLYFAALPYDAEICGDPNPFLGAILGAGVALFVSSAVLVVVFNLIGGVFWTTVGMGFSTGAASLLIFAFGFLLKIADGCGVNMLSQLIIAAVYIAVATAIGIGIGLWSALLLIYSE